MIESFKESLVKWNANTNERAKLQQVYLTLAVCLVLGAGLIGLVNHTLGQNVLVVAIVSAGVFLVNAVIWALLQSAIVTRLPKRTSVKNTKSSR